MAVVHLSVTNAVPPDATPGHFTPVPRAGSSVVLTISRSKRLISEDGEPGRIILSRRPRELNPTLGLCGVLGESRSRTESVDRKEEWLELEYVPGTPDVGRTDSDPEWRS